MVANTEALSRAEIQHPEMSKKDHWEGVIKMLRWTPQMWIFYTNMDKLFT